jgi:hypothetical protein
MAKTADDQAGSAVRELRAEADRLFPGAVLELAVLRYGDDPMVEPGETMVRVRAIRQLTEEGEGRPRPGPLPAFKSPAMQEFRQEVTRRLPGVRRIEVLADSPDGKRTARISVRADDEHDDKLTPDQGEFTPVMVRMRAAELEIVDTLISAGIAPNRAEAVRWALGRISDRPAYTRLRERTREIEQLKSQF